jgi:O-6-methylguanine DNA methyltransferase
MERPESAQGAPRWRVTLNTALGIATLEGYGEAICTFGWLNEEVEPPQSCGILGKNIPHLLETLQEFLCGDASRWNQLRIAPLLLTGTPFQQRVWEALRNIPNGRTVSYGTLAIQLGLATSSARAVGSACGCNPVALFIPCHRVLDASGSLGGFKWGLARKRTLLALEQPSQMALFT